jgi:phosphoglycerate dehydrogenase-like enzyme
MCAKCFRAYASIHILSLLHQVRYRKYLIIFESIYIMMKTMRVLIASPRFSGMSSILQMVSNDIQVIMPVKGTEEELIQLASDVDVIVCVTLAKEVAKAAKKLKFIQKTGAGVDGIPFDVLGADVVIANTSGANPVPLAEGTVALVLALAKQIVRRHTLFPQSDRTTRSGIELRGKTAGLIGLGHIGMSVARLLKAFEMKIVAIKRNPKDITEITITPDFLGGPEHLDYLLRDSDFVIITAPSTPETRGMIGERELHLMKTTAYLVNVARANLLQEEPLYKALTEGWIAGAALDVWWPPHWWDPTWGYSDQIPKYQFWKLPNVIATPHNIGSSDIRSDAGLQIIAENIRRISKGILPLNQVDKILQY